MRNQILSLLLFFAPLSQAEVELEGFVLNSTVEAFVAADNKLSYCDEYLCFINASLALGADGKVPETQLSHLSIRVNGIDVPLETTGMYNPFEDETELLQRASMKPYWGDLFKLSLHLSDGAGGYIGQWVFSESGSSRIFLGTAKQLSELHSGLMQ